LFLKRASLSVLVSLAALLTACISVPEELRYQEPDLPPEKIAVLLTHHLTEYPNWVTIEGVDGKNILRMLRWSQRVEVLPGKHQIVKVLPGKHKISAVYADRGFLIVENYWVNIPVNVEAGHTYQIKGRKAENRVRIWLEDVENKEVIGVGTIFDASGK